MALAFTVANGSVFVYAYYVIIFRGSALALSSTFAVYLVLIIAYIRFSGCYKETWAGTYV